VATGIETGVTMKSADGTKRPVVRVAVSDQGPGIPPDDLDRIFTPFYSTKAKGTGLGLAMTQQIVDAHDGHLSVTSNPGSGTTFVLTLPADI
jgi:two-component system nitrogen regulation sensor histidine kinase GlnL